MKGSGFCLCIVTAGLWLLLGVGCSPKADTYPGRTIFMNGVISPLDELGTEAEAMVVEAGKILFIGSFLEANSFTGLESKSVNLNGREVVPQFATLARPVWAYAWQHTPVLALDPAWGIYTLQGRLRNLISDTATSVVVARGFNPESFEFTPTTEELDLISREIALVLLSEDLSEAWCNSAALKRAGITAETADPVAESHYYVRDEEGNPSGYMYGYMSFLPILEKFDFFTSDMLLAGMQKAVADYGEAGFSALYDEGCLFFSDQMRMAMTRLINESDSLPCLYGVNLLLPETPFTPEEFLASTVDSIIPTPIALIGALAVEKQSVEEALRFYSIDIAALVNQNFELKVGAPASFNVLSQNLIRTLPEEVENITVIARYVEGERQ